MNEINELQNLINVLLSEHLFIVLSFIFTIVTVTSAVVRFINRANIKTLKSNIELYKSRSNNKTIELEESANYSDLKARLEVFKLFYYEEKKIVERKLKKSKEDVSRYKQKLIVAKSNIDEKNKLKEKLEFFESEVYKYKEKLLVTKTSINDIYEQLSKNYFEIKNINSIAQRREKYLLNEKSNLEEICQRLEHEKEQKQVLYRNLVLYIKSKHGINALVDFHYSDDMPIEAIKARIKENNEQKYKKNSYNNI